MKSSALPCFPQSKHLKTETHKILMPVLFFSFGTGLLGLRVQRAQTARCCTVRMQSEQSASKGKARANLGDTMYTSIGVADLGGRILKWAKTDEKL